MNLISELMVQANNYSISVQPMDQRYATVNKLDKLDFSQLDYLTNRLGINQNLKSS